MYIEAVPNWSSPPAILLRESYRQDGRIRKRTLCNLSDWPAAYIEGLRGVLKGGTVIPAEHDAFTVTRSLPHGHVAAALGTAHKIGLDRILGLDGDRCRDLVLALLVGRILDPTSKLAAARALSPDTAASSLGEVLGFGEVDEDELYAALDWLLERQPAIEATLAKRHLTHGTLVLYDVSSSYMEGRCCPLAKRGYSRDGRKGTLQIVYGLLCAPDGCPAAIEVFDGNTADPMTLASQIDKLKQRFHLDHVVLVGAGRHAGARSPPVWRATFFESLDGARLLRVMAWARRQLAVSDGPQLAAERLLRDADLVFLPDPLAEIDDPPADHAVHRRDRAVLDHRRKRCALFVIEPRRLAGSLAVDQSPGPCALNRRTQSRTTCSVTPPAAAACVRLPPS